MCLWAAKYANFMRVVPATYGLIFKKVFGQRLPLGDSHASRNLHCRNAIQLTATG
jgi:hypothetical protein